MWVFRLVLVVLLVTACGACASPVVGELGVRAGCSFLTTDRREAGSLVVMDVVARGCLHDADPTRIAGAVWKTLHLGVDGITVRIDESSTAPVMVDRAALLRRFGPGPSRPVSPETRGGGTASLWLLLPILCCLGAVGAIGLTVRAARAGALFILLR